MSILKNIGEFLFGGKSSQDSMEYRDDIRTYCDYSEDDDDDCRLCDDYTYNDDYDWLD